MIITMGRFFSRAYRTICKPAPAKLLRVGIKHFLVSPGSWHSCYIIISCHRAEITDNHNAFLHFIHPAENNNILLVIIGDKPLKALPRILNLPERRMFQIVMIQFFYVLLLAAYVFMIPTAASPTPVFHSIQ